MARLRSTKGNYYARFYDASKTPPRKTVPLGTKNKRTAEAALKRLEVQYAEGRFDPWATPETPAPRLSEAIEQFLDARQHRAASTLRVYRVVLGGLLDHCGNRTLADLDARGVAGFLASRALNDTGRESYFVRIRAFVRWCHAQGYTDTVITDQVDVPRAPRVFPHFLTRGEFDRLCRTIARASKTSHEAEVGWLTPLVTVAVFTGLRLGELAELRWRDVDLTNRRLWVRNDSARRTKNRRDRVVPLVTPVVDALAALPRSSPRVFTGAGGEPLNKDYASKAFLRYRRRAGLDDTIHFHSLRHTCASWLVQAGVSLVRVKEILGHASIETTMRYAHLAPSNALSEMENALAADVPGTP